MISDGPGGAYGTNALLRIVAWAALKRGKRPARPSDDLPKQEL